jgi:hypothetical protein
VHCIFLAFCLFVLIQISTGTACQDEGREEENEAEGEERGMGEEGREAGEEESGDGGDTNNSCKYNVVGNYFSQMLIAMLQELMN